MPLSVSSMLPAVLCGIAVLADSSADMFKGEWLVSQWDPRRPFPDAEVDVESLTSNWKRLEGILEANETQFEGVLLGKYWPTKRGGDDEAGAGVKVESDATGNGIVLSLEDAENEGEWLTVKIEPTFLGNARASAMPYTAPSGKGGLAHFFELSKDAYYLTLVPSQPSTPATSFLFRRKPAPASIFDDWPLFVLIGIGFACAKFATSRLTGRGNVRAWHDERKQKLAQKEKANAVARRLTAPLRKRK
ncbi:hypothetical protein DIPPA_03994 [Diplonema papillatum]|nr:hypothetical protein DIPPA_03994 [Diplonema papillatum]